MVRIFVDESILQEVVSCFPISLLLVLIVLSLVMLSKGADWMIDGVVALARRTGLPRIVIGATIVSVGTTTPEVFVSVMAAWYGNPGLALGNGVGSIIVDTGLIFGLTCCLTTVPMNRFIINRTGWVQVGVATLLVVIAVALLLFRERPPVLGRGIGGLLLVLLVGYLYIAYIWAKKGAKGEAEGAGPEETINFGRTWLMILGGLFLVIIGARILIPCASSLAMRMGVPDDVIAATMIAFGTSLPELMTAVASVRKGHPEITVGNIVGADVLNCLFVVGAAAAARPLEIPPNFYTLHFPAMLIILYSFRLFIFVNRDGRFKRAQGAWLVGLYVAYLALQYVFDLGGA